MSQFAVPKAFIEGAAYHWIRIANLEERKGDHHARTVRSQEEPRLRRLVLASVGPASVTLVVSDGVHAHAQEERDGEPNQCAPRAVQVFVVPNLPASNHAET